MSWPIHSELMRPIAEAIAPMIAGLFVRSGTPAVPYYGPEGRAVENGEEVRRLLGSAFCFPTLWKDTFEAMTEDGHRLYLEVGPGDMLSKMVRWIDRSTRAVPAGTAPATAAVDKSRPDETRKAES